MGWDLRGVGFPLHLVKTGLHLTSNLFTLALERLLVFGDLFVDILKVLDFLVEFLVLLALSNLL